MASDVFSGVLFYVIQCDSPDLIDILKSRRALNHPILSDRVKFAISDDNKSDQVGEAEDLYAIPVVTSEWVRLSLETNTFLPFAPFHPNFRKIFTDVTAVFSELSLKDCITLSAHITIRGGLVKTTLDSSVTHLICGRAAGNLYDFCKNCMEPDKVKIVSPDWVIECVKADKCINWDKYNIDLLVKPSPPKTIKLKPVPARPSAPVNDPQANSWAMAAQQQQQQQQQQQPQVAKNMPDVNVSFAGSLQTPSGPNASASQQMSTNFDVISGQMARMVSQSSVGKGTKGKSSRHARDQDLNEEQKDAIVMQNVMNILGQQHNWNRDNLQSRTGGTVTGSTSTATTFGSTGSEPTFAGGISNTAGGHSLPGSFLPSGTSPQPAISTGARKSKSPKSPSRSGVPLASAGGTNKTSARGPAGAYKASRAASTAASRLTPTAGELHQQQQRQQLHLPLTPTPLPLAPISVDALPAGATATVGGQSQSFAVVGGTAQIFQTHPQQHTVFVASGAVHPGLNRGATQNARMAMTPSIAAATGVVGGQQQSAQQTQQQQPGHQQSTQQAYLMQQQYPQTAMPEQYQQVQQQQQQQQQLQQQTVVTAQGQLKKAQRRPVGQTQMASAGVLLSQQQQQQQAQYQTRPTTLIVRAPPTGLQPGIRPMDQVSGDPLKIATIDATSQVISTTSAGQVGNRNLVAQQQQQQQQQQTLIQGGVNSTHSAAGTPTRISQQLLQENLQSAAVATPSSSSSAAYTQLGQLQHPQRVLLQPSGQLIQVQSASPATPTAAAAAAFQLQAQRQAAARGVPSSVSPAAGLVPSVYLQGRQAIPPPSPSSLSTAALQYKQQLQQMSPSQQQQQQLQVTAGTQPAQIVGHLQQQQQQAQRPQTPSTALQRSNMLRQAQAQAQQQQQLHYAGQLSQQQQLKPAAQHQLVSGQLAAAGSQQIIIQTSNGTQMVAQAQDLGSAQFVETASTKYIGGQLRAVGTSPAVQCASPRPPTYSLSQTGTINGSTTSIVYHSTASVESPSPQQGRATYLTMQGKTEGLMPLIKPETGVCRQQSQTHSGVGMDDSLAVSQQLQGQVLQQQQQQQQQPQPQHPQQQQHIIVQTQQNPLQQHTVLQQGTPVHIHPQQQQQHQTATATATVVTQNQHLQLQQGHPLRPAGMPHQKVMGGALPLQATGPAGYGQLVNAQHIALADPMQRQQQQQQAQLMTAGGQRQLDHALLAQQQQQQQQQHLQRAQRMPLQNQSWQQQQQQACRGAALTPQRQSVVPPRTMPASAAAAAAVPGGQPRTQNAPQPAAAAASAVSLFQFPSYVGHVGDFSPSASEDCLVGCVFLLLGYHSFGETQKTLWKRIMRSYGAEIVLTYEPSRVTHVVVDWQLEEPELFKQALRDKKRVVTIYWVNDVLAKGKMIPPYEILHLPSPFCHEVTFSFIRSQVISVTGFEGIERQKIELIIKQLGASFTDYLDQSNTLLVFKRPQGKKYEMASLWGIPCVNVRWLQDLYLGDLLAISSEIPHKYLSCEQSDVSQDLDLRTLRVMELMVGWQIGISLNKTSWSRVSELRAQLKAEQEVERLKQLLENADEKENKCVLEELTPEEMTLAENCKLRRTVLQEESLRAEAHRAAVAARQQAAAAEAAAAAAATPSYSTAFLPLQPAPTPLVSYLHQTHQQQQETTAAAAAASTVVSALAAQPAATSMASLLLSTPSVSLTTTTTADLNDSATSTASCRTQAPEQIATTTLESISTASTSVTAVEVLATGLEPQAMEANTPQTDKQQAPHDPLQNSRKRPHDPEDNSSPLSKLMHLEPRSVPPLPASPPPPPPICRPASVPPVATAEHSDELIPPSVVVKPEESNPSLPAQVSLQVPPPAISTPPACVLPTATTTAVSNAVPVPASLPQLLPQPLPQPPKPALNLEVRITFTALSWESRLAVTELLRKMAASADPDVAPYTIVNTVAEATHLVTDRLIRTPKIYQAVAYGRPIVTPKWVQACLHRGDWVDEWEWLLVDPEAEENLGIHLADSLRRSHERAILNESGLFEGMEIWFSPQARHREVCEELVRICGGRDRDRRPTQKMALMPVPRQIIVCHEDEAHVATYLMRTKTGNRAVQHEEFVLSGVLRQELDFESYQIQYVSSLYAELQSALSTGTKSLASSVPPPVPRNSSIMASSLGAPDPGSCHKMKPFYTHASSPGVTAAPTATKKVEVLNGNASPLKTVNRNVYPPVTASAMSHWNHPELPQPRPLNIHPGNLSEHSQLLLAYSQSSCSSTTDTQGIQGSVIATARPLSLGVPFAVNPSVQGISSSVGRLFSTKLSPPLETVALTTIVESSSSQPPHLLVNSIPPVASSHLTSREPVSSSGSIPLTANEFTLSVTSPASSHVSFPVSLLSAASSSTTVSSDAAVNNCFLLVAEQQQLRSASTLPQQATSVMLLPTASSSSSSTCLISGTFERSISGLPPLPPPGTAATPTLLVSAAAAASEAFTAPHQSSSASPLTPSITSTAYLVRQCTTSLETSLASALQLPAGVSAVFVSPPPTAATAGLAPVSAPLNARVAAADAHAVASATAAALSAISNQTATAAAVAACSKSLMASSPQKPPPASPLCRPTVKPDPGLANLPSFAATSTSTTVAPRTKPSPVASTTTSSSPSLPAPATVMTGSEAFSEETLLLPQTTAPPSKAANLIINSSSSAQLPLPSADDDADGRQVVEASVQEVPVAASEALIVTSVSSDGSAHTTADPSCVEIAPLSANMLELTAPTDTGTTDSLPAAEMMDTTPPV